MGRSLEKGRENLCDQICRFKVGISWRRLGGRSIGTPDYQAYGRRARRESSSLVTCVLLRCIYDLPGPRVYWNQIFLVRPWLIVQESGY